MHHTPFARACQEADSLKVRGKEEKHFCLPFTMIFDGCLAVLLSLLLSFLMLLKRCRIWDLGRSCYNLTLKFFEILSHSFCQFYNLVSSSIFQFCQFCYRSSTGKISIYTQANSIVCKSLFYITENSFYI